MPQRTLRDQRTIRANSWLFRRPLPITWLDFPLFPPAPACLQRLPFFQPVQPAYETFNDTRGAIGFRMVVPGGPAVGQEKIAAAARLLRPAVRIKTAANQDRIGR
jgi:hypothetical protein